jgi:cell division protein FtsI/penicillin-binding protein 2
MLSFLKRKKKNKRFSKRDRDKEKYGRLNFVLAIIFLMMAAVLAKLISLQVFQYDLYIALASGQHQVNSLIEPARGRIFIKDDKDKLYPLATNKDFAHVYAVPKKIKDPEYASNSLYEIFDKEALEKSVIDGLKRDEYFKPLFEPAASGTPELAEEEREALMGFFEIKRDLEIKDKSAPLIDAYYQKLSKKNDPYEPIKNKVNDELLQKVLSLDITGIDYVMQKHRYYPEKNIGSHLIGFVGYEEAGKKGRYGLEGFFNDELGGKSGSIKAERSAGGSVVIISDREYVKPVEGSDLILTLDRSVQYTACEKLKAGVIKYGADGGSVIVMEPDTGAILAMCSWPDYDPNNFEQTKDINVFNNPAIFNSYEPGSIFKIITMAAGLDSGVVKPNSTYEDKGAIMIPGWNKPIKNSDYETRGAHGVVDMISVLEDSLNTGVIHVMQKVGPKKFADYIRDFGFGEKCGIELHAEGVTNIKSLLAANIRPIEAATASFGQGITVTPLQITAAVGAVANGGMLMKPFLVKELVTPDGIINKTQPTQIRRVISEKSALLLSGMAVKVVEGGHATGAGVKGYYVGGKTGTAQVADAGGYGKKTIHSFIGFAPAENPKFVMLVKLDHPKNVPWAASSAAPLFSEIAEFILNYYQIPKERE